MILQRGERAHGEVHLGSDKVVLLTINTPWRQALVQCQNVIAQHKGQRIVLQSVCGLVDGCWHDGPLAHVLPDSTVASYIPSGGPATLAIPDQTDPLLRGIDWEEAIKLEGSHSAQLLRCLAAELAARLPAGPLTFNIVTPDQRAAAVLAVIRKVRSDERITVNIRQASSGFRRFAQNAGVYIASGALGLNLEDYWSGVTAGEAAGLIDELNKLSVVIPKV